MRKVKEKGKISISIITCTMIFVLICVLETENKLALVVGGIAIGSHIMLLFDMLEKRKSDKK